MEHYIRLISLRSIRLILSLMVSRLYITSFLPKHSRFTPTREILHKLIDILFIAVAAFIAGADDWEVVVAFAQRREREAYSG